MGMEEYQGKLCRKIEGDGNAKLSISGITTSYTFNLEGYMDSDTGMPKKYSYKYHYSEPQKIDKTIELTWNRAQGVMVSEVSVSGQKTTVTAHLPEEYWEPIENLSIGHRKEITYTVESPTENLSTNSVTLKIQIKGREDVTVPKGVYENCYVVKATQPELGQEFTYWITEDGVVPKTRFSQSIGLTSFELTGKLEHYGYAP